MTKDYLNEKEDLDKSARITSNPSLEDFLAEALEITLKIQSKKQEVETLTEEIEQLEEELIGFSSEHKWGGGFALVNAVYYDKQSNQLFTVDRCRETDKVVFTKIKPVNFNPHCR